MARLLIALATCSDALELSPLLAQPELGLLAIVPLWLGDAAGLVDAHALGLPRTALQQADTAQGDVVLLAGYSLAIQRFALHARHAGAKLVRWNAGQRSHAAEHGEEAERRLTDHLAHAHCCSSECQRDELLREGIAPQRIAVVGSLWAHAVATPSHAGGGVWLALEHRRTVADRGRLELWLQALANFARQRQLPLRAPVGLLSEALAQHGLQAPSELQLLPANALEQVQRLRTCDAIVTDASGHQELAAALGKPTVVLQCCTPRLELLRAGCVTLASDAKDLSPALAQQLARGTIPSPYADAGTQLPVALLQLVSDTQPAAATPAAASPLPSDGDCSGRTLGEDEVQLASAAIRSGTLNSTRGQFVSRFERNFAAWLGRKYAIACHSGSFAIHAAIAALHLAPGDEVVTTAITDMGALMPICYEGGLPVFADVEPLSMNVTAASIEAVLSERTRAIVVTHLFGQPADLTAILRLAEARGIPVIEDCAQAFGALERGTRVGCRGRMAAFSLQQGKHITAGEGGIVATDDAALARQLFLFVNKAWGYGDKQPDHYFPALNGRMTELQGAVLTAQLARLDGVVQQRRQVAQWLRERLIGLPGVTLPNDPSFGQHSYWKFALHIDPTSIRGGTVALGKGLVERGIACAPRYVQKPAYACAVFQQWQQHAVTQLAVRSNAARAATPWPAEHELPGVTQALERVLVLPINERYLPQHCDRVAQALRARVAELRQDAEPARV